MFYRWVVQSQFQILHTILDYKRGGLISPEQEFVVFGEGFFRDLAKENRLKLILKDHMTGKVISYTNLNSMIKREFSIFQRHMRI